MALGRNWVEVVKIIVESNKPSSDDLQTIKQSLCMIKSILKGVIANDLNNWVLKRLDKDQINMIA